MALNKAALKSGIKTLLQDMQTRETDSIDEYADRLSTLIEAFVKTGTVNPGIIVSVTGTSGSTTTAGIIS